MGNFLASRRTGLVVAATAFASWALGCTGGDDASTGADASSSRRVVVVGGGLAGLTAALDLRDSGWDVVLYEARDRVGGRVHTLRDPFTDGLHAEGGGESIDDNHDAIQALAKRYGLPLERRPANKQTGGVVYANGARQKTTDFVLSAPNLYADYTRYYDALGALAAGLDPLHPELFANAAALDARSIADFTADQHLVPGAELLVTTQNRGEYNAEPSKVSLLFALQQVAVAVGVPDSAVEAMRISGGNSLLPEAMARDLGSIVLLGSPVTKIEEHSDDVRVSTASASSDAAYVVVAIPTPPLRKIAFDPPLPADLAAMVAELDLGQAAKVVTQYDARFWEPLGVSGFTVTDLPFAIGWSPTDSYASQKGLLSQFITGDAAAGAAKLDDAARITQFQSQLDAVYPEGVAHKDGHSATVAWANEPFTGGGYTAWAPGQMTRFWPALRKGTPRIRFAGEHTEPLAGYMESAVRAGHRVAKELGVPPALSDGVR